MYSKECVETFLKQQGQLFDEPVAETYEEAEEFCKNDMMAMKMEHVVAIREIDDYEAHQFFDMDEEERYPIFR